MRQFFHFILFAGFSLAFLPAFAQEQKTPTQPTDTSQFKIFTYVEVNPEYPGGQDALSN